MKREIIIGAVALIWAVVSIMQFMNNDITMGVIYGVVAIVFVVAFFAKRNK